MLPQWTLNLKDHEEKKRFRRYIYSSKGVIDRLRELIEQEEANISRKEYSEGAYDSPSWAALQAHRNGKRDAFNYVKQLLTLDPKDETINEPS